MIFFTSKKGITAAERAMNYIVELKASYRRSVSSRGYALRNSQSTQSTTGYCVMLFDVAIKQAQELGPTSKIG